MSSLPPLSGGAGLGNLGTPTGLGNLAQSARRRHIGGARKILIIIGIINLLFGVPLMGFAESMANGLIEKQVKDLNAQGMIVPQEDLEKARQETTRGFRLAGGISLVQGLVYLSLAVVVQRFPVPITILALVIYLGSNAIGAFFDPSSLLAGGIIGVVIKIAIIVALARAVKAAIAYQRETGQVVGKPSAVGLGVDL